MIGLQPSPQDSRDYLYASGIASLPASVNLQPFAGPVRDQGQTNACSSAAATCGAIEIMLTRASTPMQLSMMQHYYNERRDDGMWPMQDTGINLRQAFRVINKYGVILESDYPFDPVRINDVPGAFPIVARAARYESCGHGTQDSLNALKCALAEGFPVVIGLNITSQLDTLRLGDVYLGTQGAAGFRGHALCAVGYDNATQTIRIRNSWGANWCDGGYFDLPYSAYLTDVYESWACTALEGVSLAPRWIAPVKNTRIYLENGDTFSLQNSGCSVFGNVVPGTLNVTQAARNVRADANVKTLCLPERKADKLEFLQVGTVLEIHESGLLLVSWTINDDVTLRTSDYALQVHIGLIDVTFGITVQGMLVSKVAPTPLGGFP